MKCQCGRDTLFMDDLGCGPLVCRRCGALLCPLCGDEPCQKCERKKTALGVTVGDVVVRGEYGVRCALIVAMVDESTGWIWANPDGKLRTLPSGCVYGSNGRTVGFPISDAARGPGIIRLPLEGELDMIRVEEEHREREAAELHKETELMVEIYTGDRYGLDGDNLYGLAGVAARYRLALRKIVKNPDNAERIAREVLGE